MGGWEILMDANRCSRFSSTNQPWETPNGGERVNSL